MPIEPGELVASGRSADVFDQGDGTILRRYRSDHDSKPEARVMVWLHERGYPVPVVHHVADRDLLMDRVPGPTMMADLARRPWKVVTHVRTLAELQKALGAMTAPSWLATDPRVPCGPSVLHLDLHPMNVILGPEGPVVIDWTNARRGDGDFDAALSYLLMTTFEATELEEVVAQQVVTRLFRSLRGRRAIRHRLVDAARFRLDDRNLTGGERVAVERILDRADPAC